MISLALYIIITIAIGYISFKIIKNKIEAKQKKLLWISFFLGIGVFILNRLIVMRFVYTLIFSFGLEGDNFQAASMTVNSIVIELIKYSVIMLIIYKKEEFKDILSGVVFAVMVSLGVASCESVFALGYYYYPVYNLSVLFIIVNVFSAILMGYFIGAEKFDENKKKELHLMGVGGAVILKMGFYYLSIPQIILYDIIIAVLLISGASALYYYSKKYITV